MELDRQDAIVNSLLQPLGISMEIYGNRVFYVDLLKTAKISVCDNSGIFLLPWRTSSQSTTRLLFNEIAKFCFYYYIGSPAMGRTRSKKIDNPYLGCKTLEEALIKKDLLDIKTQDSNTTLAT